MVNKLDVLKAYHGLPVDDPTALIWGWMLRDSIRSYAEMSGELPLTFIANGSPLKDYRIYGSTFGSQGVGIDNGGPYGYSIPVTVRSGRYSAGVTVYIGSGQLMQDEYISFAEQKVYRKTGGVLTPTQPPVPLPAVPTFSGTNVIDTELVSVSYLTADGLEFADADGRVYLAAGSVLRPETAYIKYKEGR